MFAGGRRRSSSVRAMQLFHELKQQFPAVPDHVVTSCIANAVHSSDYNREALEAAVLNTQVPMGHTPSNEPVLALPPHERDPSATSAEMNDSDSDLNQNVVKPSVVYSKKSETVSVNADAVENTVGKSLFYVKRPTHLNIQSDVFAASHKKNAFQFRDRSLQPSEKCKDVHKLLNSDKVNDKPPRSPLSNRRFSGGSAKNSPAKISPLASPETSKKSNEVPQKRETPTQTTDTLIGGNSVNLSLNVNCSMDVVQSPTRPRRSSVLQLTPQQPWIQEPVSPRSYTSVNLTLRPPTSEPQAPIDITSQNSSLTYSTSTFDSQKGLQSRLQITVGPGGGSVASVRTRPRSSYVPENDDVDVVPTRAGSLPDLAASNEAPIVIKQQARIERLRIELQTEKTKLTVMKQEVAELESKNLHRADEELEKQLQREIQHLRCQCERLTTECDRPAEADLNQINANEDFYRNIYTGQSGPLLDLPVARPVRGRLQYQGPMSLPQPEADGPKWNCHMCTFQNHPLLNKCEQCDMPRILHVSAAPGDNIHIHVTPRISRRVVHSWVI